MKKTRIKENSIKSMAIGLTAMVSLTSPMTAMAATEGETDTLLSNEGTVQQKNSGEAIDSSKVAEVRDESIQLTEEEKKNDQGQVIEEAGSVKEAENKEKAVVDAVDAIEKDNLVEEVKAASESLKKETTVEKVDENGNKEVVNKATEDMKPVVEELSHAEKQAEVVENELQNAEQAAKEADTVIEGLNKTVKEKTDEIDKEIDKINKATNLADAKNAQLKVENLKNVAEKALDSAETELDTAKQSYEEAKSKAEAANAAYQTALALAEKNINQPIEDLEKAVEEAEKLKAAAEQALDMAKINKEDMQKALDIVNAQKIISEDKKINWHHEDNLFNLIMKNYYLPEVLNKDPELVKNGWTASLDEEGFHRFSPSKENYIKVFYKDADGKVVDTKYYNFQAKDDEKKIVIFEKTEGEKIVKEYDHTCTPVNKTELEDYDKYKAENPKGTYLVITADDTADEGFKKFLNDSKNKAAADEIKEGLHGINGSWNWYKKYGDPTFRAVMNNYFIPNVLLPNEKEGNTIVLGDLVKSGNGHNTNHFELSIKNKDGKIIKNRYFNYDMYKYDADPNYGKMIIFENKTVYNDVKKEILLNDNYDNYIASNKENKTGIFLDEITDEGLKEFLENALNADKVNKQKEEYENVIKAAEEARLKAEKAKKDVEALQQKIATLKKSRTTTMDELAAISEKLRTAEVKYSDAKNNKKQLDEKLEESKDALKKTEERLTVKVEEETNPNVVTEDETVSPIITGPALVTTRIAPTGIPLATNQTTVIGQNVNTTITENDENEENVIIEEEQVPLSDQIESQEEMQTNEDTKQEVTTIADEEVPMSADAKERMSWWWLLLVILFGGTGYAMYKKHQSKKEELSNRG